MDDQGVKKRKYDSESSKRKLMQAGIEVFSEDGYDAATTRKIAQVAGVNESLIHRYFENKHGLFFAILTEFHEQLIQASPYPAGETFEEELRNFFQFRMQFSQKQKKFLRLGIMRAILDQEARDQLQILAKNTPGLLTRFEKLRSQGKIRSDVNLEQLSTLVGGIAFSMSMFTDVVFKIDRPFADEILSLAAQILSKDLTPKKADPTLTAD